MCSALPVVVSLARHHVDVAPSSRQSGMGARGGGRSARLFRQRFARHLGPYVTRGPRRKRFLIFGLCVSDLHRTIFTTGVGIDAFGGSDICIYFSTRWKEDIKAHVLVRVCVV